SLRVLCRFGRGFRGAVLNTAWSRIRSPPSHGRTRRDGDLMSRRKVTRRGGMTVTDRDLGWDEIKRLLTEDVRQSHVKVGVIGTEATDDRGQITNARLMAVHEFGAQVGNVSIPERAPIRSTFDA